MSQWTGKRVSIKEDWHDAGRKGTAMTEPFQSEEGCLWWVTVLWDDEEDPDCHKYGGLEICPPGDGEMGDGI